MSSVVESIPDLMRHDAEALRRNLAEHMGVSLKGISEDGLRKKFPLDPTKPVKKTIKYAVVVVPVLAVFLLLNPFGLTVAAVAAAAAAVLILVKYVYECRYYASYFYDMNDDALVIKKGVFGFREIIIPFSKIQDVFIDQDILDRFFGLRDVYVSTVTQRSIMNAHIDGLSQTTPRRSRLCSSTLQKPPERHKSISSLLFSWSWMLVFRVGGVCVRIGMSLFRMN